MRSDHLRAGFDPRASARRQTPWGPGLVAVFLTVAVGLVLVARPIHEPPVPPGDHQSPGAAPAAITETRAVETDAGERLASAPPRARRPRLSRPAETPPPRLAAIVSEARLVASSLSLLRSLTVPTSVSWRPTARDPAQSP